LLHPIVRVRAFIAPINIRGAIGYVRIIFGFSGLLKTPRSFVEYELLMRQRVLLTLVLFIATSLRAATIPSGLGVNIHFTHPKEGEIEQIASAGFTIVRMDFTWSAIEQTRGQYDWSAYEHLLKTLQPHHIGAIFILDYGNPLYDDGLSPHTDEGRAAFAKWAAAAVTHFKNRNILWEMYNEPNIDQFWHPKANADDYVKLATEVGKAIRAAAPEEKYIGPACSTMDFKFLEACFKGGLLEYWSAVSVHPYRQTPPETVEADYGKLKQLIAQYGPKEKSIPIYSGEWGYSSGWDKFDEAKQGKYLPRQWLTNLESGVPISIWYDWHDDGEDPKEPEHHFGTVHHDYTAKPAYLAAKKLARELAGYRFEKRIKAEKEEDHLLLFVNDKGEKKLAAWTISSEPHTVIAAEWSDHAIALSDEIAYF
jgi:hypothetical protein